LALRGELGPLEAEAIAIELDDLPLPVHFDVHLADLIRHRELREHIDRAGQIFYRRCRPRATSGPSISAIAKGKSEVLLEPRNTINGSG
ncbi:MAG: hypothetical protein M3429_03400, partial [Verrucomicrobiota bacterium]|nr:hypothetical protein [Verrucomicrobiota bacterium]